MAGRRINTARKGRAREHAVRDLLLAPCDSAHPAYRVVLRSAGSKGPFDLLAVCFQCRELVAVQVKAGRAWPGRQEMQRLKRLLDSPVLGKPWAVRGQVWRWPDRQAPEVRSV